MERIVVGVDGSPCADAALRLAAEEARTHGCELVVVHAWTFPYAAGVGFVPVMAPEIDHGHLELQAKKTLAEAVARVLGAEDGGLVVSETVVEGPTGRALIEAAAGARMLVVGSHGRGGLSELILGSVSHHCAHHAPCPVLIVREPD